MWAWIVGLFEPELKIALWRAQLEERVERRQSLDRELAGRDAQECVERVQRRMRDGDANWIPPMYGRVQAFRAWRRDHRKHRRGVLPMPNAQEQK